MFKTEFQYWHLKRILLSQVTDHLGIFEKFSFANNRFYRGGYKDKLIGQWWLEKK